MHGRVIFVGDSAHVVSLFGARGVTAASMMLIIWGELAAVLKGDASAELLMSYQTERAFGADENIANSSRRRIS